MTTASPKLVCVPKSALRRKVARSLSSQVGAALVEYAFIVIVFLVILFGIGGFSHMLYVYHYVNHAAKEAARYASVRGSTCTADADGGSCQVSNSASGISGPTTSTDVQTYVTNMVFAGVDSSKLVVPTTNSSLLCGVSDKTKCSPAIDSDICNSTAAVNAPGCSVRVTVAYSYNFIFPLLPGSTTTTAPCTSAGFCLKSTAEMIIIH